MSWWYPRYTPTRPIPVKGGIKARSQRGAIGKSWWAQRWTAALRRIMDSGRLSRGRSYARRGQVMDIHVQDGEITAKVQGSRRTPYEVYIRVKPLKDAEWERVLDVLVGQAIFTAQLLAGEMPTDIEVSLCRCQHQPLPGLSQGTGYQLLPAPTRANPCKHIAAVYFLLGEAFDDDPFIAFSPAGPHPGTGVGGATRPARRARRRRGRSRPRSHSLACGGRRLLRPCRRTQPSSGAWARAWTISRCSQKRPRYL